MRHAGLRHFATGRLPFVSISSSASDVSVMSASFIKSGACQQQQLTCSAATCTGVRPSPDLTRGSHPRSRASVRTVSSRFQAAAQYSGVQPSRSSAAASQPCSGSAHGALAGEHMWATV